MKLHKLFFIFSLLCFQINAQQSPVDSTFGVNGIVKTNIATSFGMMLADVINVTYQYPDGKILAAGHSDRSFSMARYNSDGSLDLTFNPTGIGFVPPGTVQTVLSQTFYDEIYSIAVHPDGKIIACGYIENSNNNKWIALVRYTSTGLLDPSFGTNGIAKIKVPVTNSFDHNSIPKKIFIDSDKYTIVGYVENSFTGTKSDFFLAKVNFDGTIDAKFGVNGFVTTDLESSGFDIVHEAIQQPDGKIVVVGSWSATESSIKFNVVVRYNPDGTLDTSFGTGGIIKHQFVGSFPIKHEEAESVVVLNDGKIVVAGTVTKESNEKDFYIIRYNSDGTLDNTFGSKGFTFVDFDGKNDEVFSMALQSDGRYVLAGSSTNSSFLTDIAVARFNENGTFEKKFNLDLGSIQEVANSVFITSDGKIIVGGFMISGIFADFLLVQFKADLPTDLKTETNDYPNNFVLAQNYPNPFNPSTTISFTIPNSEFVTLKVYDILGNEVATLVDEYKSAGIYNYQFSISNFQLSSGVYFYKLKAGSFTQSKKMILLK